MPAENSLIKGNYGVPMAGKADNAIGAQANRRATGFTEYGNIAST